MQLTVFNGSPRGKGSNSKRIMDRFLEGFGETDGNTFNLVCLKRVKEHDEYVRMFSAAEQIIMVFPLYTDAMPGIVKAFIEALAPLKANKKNPPIGFIVHSGFVEACHSRSVERYVKKLASRLNSQYLGTVIKGGSEGMQFASPKRLRKLTQPFYELGKIFGQTGRFDDKITQRLARPERLSAGWRAFIKFLDVLGVVKMGWNIQLKRNNAYKKRNDKPFAE